MRSAKNQVTYLKCLRSYGNTLADSVREEGRITVPTVTQMRSKGKIIMELKHALPHTRGEMMANAPRGIIKIGGGALVQAVKNSSQAKIQSWENMPQAAKDDFEEAAKKMNVAALRKALKEYFGSDPEKCAKINKMPRGDCCKVPETLLYLIVGHWKEN